MSGSSLDQPSGSVVRRNIKIFDITGKTATQIEDSYNTDFGLKGWRIIQIIDIGTSRFIVAEREI